MAATPRPPVADLVTIAAVSGAVMLYQVALTRVLSVVVWYHYAFLTISLVMFGLGLPGVWFARSDRPLRWLPHALLATAVTVPLSIVGVVHLGPQSFSGSWSTLAIIVSVLPATLAMGSAVVLLLLKAPGVQVSRMYAADLVGAAIGAAVVIPLLGLVPAPHLAAGTGLLALPGLVRFGGRWRVGAGASLVLAGTLLAWSPALDIRFNKTRNESERSVLIERWTPLARLTVVDSAVLFDDADFSWGRGRRAPPRVERRQAWLQQDGSAGTVITEFDGSTASVQHLLYDVTTVAYQLRAPERACVIGAGGGRDVLAALAAGVEQVDAVEINAETLRIVREDFRDLTGGLYERPDVQTHASEGRSFVTRSEVPFDVVQISLIDSWAASAAGAFALAENNLYTVEAFDAYLDQLTPTGLLTVSRWRGELPRLLLLARASLAARGIARPEDHLALIMGGRVGTVLVSAVPWSAQDRQRLRDVADQRGFDVVHPIDVNADAHPDIFRELVLSGGDRLAELGLNPTPPTDDRPFFFQNVLPLSLGPVDGALEAFGGLPINQQSTSLLRRTVIAVSLLAGILFLLPFVGSRLGDGRDSRGHIVRGSIYFAVVGAGFMLLENVLLGQFVLFLGHPSYATTVILASLLVGMGGGSYLAPSLGLAVLQRLGFLVAVLILGISLGLPLAFEAWIGAALPVRVGIAVLLLVPLGAVLGLFFPLGMARFGDGAKAWYWSMNGVFGVVAAALSLALSMQFGFQVTGAVAAAGYLLAWLCVRGQDPAGPGGGGTG